MQLLKFLKRLGWGIVAMVGFGIGWAFYRAFRSYFDLSPKDAVALLVLFTIVSFIVAVFAIEAVKWLRGQIKEIVDLYGQPAKKDEA